MADFSRRPPAAPATRRRPQSASGIAVAETIAPYSPRPGSALVGSRPALSKPDLISRDEMTPSPELDFTDKLKALRELIASSKSHRTSRNSHVTSKPPSSSRIIAKRTAAGATRGDLCGEDAQEVGEKLKFTASAFENQGQKVGAAVKVGNPSDKEFIARESARYSGYSDAHDSELLLDASGQKYRSRAESYSHLLTRDLDEMGAHLERDWLASERALASASASSSPKRVTFKKDHDTADSLRTQSAMDYFHHEVPERDWSVPFKASSNSYAKIETDKERGARSGRNMRSSSVDSALLLGSSHTAISLSNAKATELMIEKEVMYRQHSAHDGSHADVSPPEHDYPSGGTTTPRPVQTNVQLTSSSKSPQRQRTRRHSVDVAGRRTAPPDLSDNHSANQAPSSKEDGSGSGHWTQLLSQKRDKNVSVSSSSPVTVQSNVSFELAQRASPHSFLLQEAARQLEREDHEAKASRKKHRHRDKTEDVVVQNPDGMFDSEERLQQDEEVANIFLQQQQQPKSRKRIIIKRGSVRVVREPDDSDSNRQKYSQSGTTSQEQHSGSDAKPPRHGSTRLKPALLPQSSLDSDDSLVLEIDKDEHIVTLDKLKALLRGKRSESRPSSQPSSANTSSPSPMKAFRQTKLTHPVNNESSSPPPRQQKHIVTDSKSRTSDSDSSKPLHRKVIKRPPSVPSNKKDSHRNGLTHQAEKYGTRVSGGSARIMSERDMLGKLEDNVPKQNSTRGRPSSAPHFSSGFSSSLTITSRSACLTRSADTSANRVSQDGARRLRGRSRSQDTADGSVTNSVALAQSLRTNVQRLHQEVSMRVNQDSYLVQGLMNKADILDDKGHAQNGDDTDGNVVSSAKVVHKDVAESGEVRRRLSFEEGGGIVPEKNEVTGTKPRSQSCIPFGKRLGAGMVDTGSIPSLNGSDSNAEDTSHHNLKRSSSTTSTAVSAHQRRQTNATIDVNSNDENSFLRNVQQLSKDLATSTPRPEDVQPKAVVSSSVFASVTRQNFRSSAMRNLLSPGPERDVVPDKLTASNLRQRRPASVGAIPIRPAEGVPIGGDAADLILSHLGNASMVHLLQQLYTADDATRQAIILKAQYFKQWQTTIHNWKHQRQVYAESLKLAHKFLVIRLQRRSFLHWRWSADENRKNRMADSIHRQHMLRVGFQGFSWAVMRSKHQARTLKMKVNTIVMRASFTTWQARFESRREERMRTAFVRWHEYAYEEKSVREMQREQNKKTMFQTLFVWKEAYDRRVKENIAEKYLRRTSLQQSWRCWRHFTLSSKEKAHRCTQAVARRKRNLQRSTIVVWQTALIQSRRASQHFRTRRIQRTLQAWHQGAQISRVERQRDMATSIEHWRHITTRHTFLRWYQQLHQCRAVAMANKTLTQRTFQQWRQVWQTNSQRRQEVEAAITASRQRKCLLTWRRNVVDQRRRQRQAVMLLETCWMRVTLLSWHSYAAYKTGFRASLQQHVQVIQCTTLSRCFHLWRELLHLRLDERHKRELWSQSCVRKMTAHWRHKCHLRNLHTILKDTEPVRELGLLRRMFGRWLAAKGRAEEVTAEVVASRHILERCCLQRRFQEWRLATSRALTIRPLVTRLQRQLITRSFDAWHEHTKNRRERRNREKQFQKNQLSLAFARWRRQYHCQQVSRLAQQNLMQRVALCLLQQWREILHRKHQARLFHCSNLLRHSFLYWRGRTDIQLREKAEEQAEEELSQELKRRYFTQWWSGVQNQIADNNEAIVRLQQRHNHNHIQSSFFGWRRTLHAHLVSRAYQRAATQRLLRSVLTEWQEATCQSLCSAVQDFAQRLGMPQQHQQGEGSGDELGGSLGRSLEFGDLLNLDGGDQFGSPCSSSATSIKCLFASDQSATSERWGSGDLDLDRAALLSKGLQETMEERRNKNLHMQEMAMTFVTRLSHWPISLAFSQWQEYTLRQRQLRQFALEVEEKHRAITITMAFTLWRKQLHNCQKATKMRNWRLQCSAFSVLLEYSRHRKVKTALAQRARGHLVKHVLGKIFPWWLAKAQEQRHQRTILHLWTTATPEEAQLLPLEASLCRQIRQRSLRACLQVWRVRFLFLSKLKRVYHAQLLSRVLVTWQDWASLRHEQRKKSDKLLEARRIKLTFRRWCERMHQKRETERRYHASQQDSLRQAFLAWQDWATVSRQHRQSRHALECQMNSTCLRTHFVTWRQLTHYALTIQAAHQKHLMHSVFAGWRQAAQDKRELQQTILSFRTASLIGLVGQLFQRWQQRHQQRQQLHMQREERAQRSALQCGRQWRQQAQNTRGRKLIAVFKYNRLSRMFNHWRASLARVEDLKQRQAVHCHQKNKELMGRMLAEWRQRFKSAIMTRNFTQRLMLTILHTWKVFAKASKERRIRGLALQHALQERNLRLYFVYWHHLSVRVRSLQNNMEQRLQLRVLQAWSFTVRRRCSQRRQGEKFQRQRQQCQMAAAFMAIRSRFDYCQGLRDIADTMQAQRNRKMAIQTLERWKDALNNIVAKRFYISLLSVRVARQWLRFVNQVKAQRQFDAMQLSKAITHHNSHICRAVLGVLKQEVKVKQQLQCRRQRLVIRFATRWKHITDMAVTAALMEEERIYARYWHLWRLAFARCLAANRDATLHRRQLLSQVFTSWRSICPSHVKMDAHHSSIAERRHPAVSTRVVSGDSGRDSPTIPRSFLPVPVSSARRSMQDHNHR